jgi:hypothetical protein
MAATKCGSGCSEPGVSVLRQRVPFRGALTYGGPPRVVILTYTCVSRRQINTETWLFQVESRCLQLGRSVGRRLDRCRRLRWDAPPANNMQQCLAQVYISFFPRLNFCVSFRCIFRSFSCSVSSLDRASFSQLRRGCLPPQLPFLKRLTLAGFSMCAKEAFELS